MKKTIAILCLMLFTIQSAMAQRFTDKLDRGLVVVPTGSTDGSTTNFVSWRRLANEYYGVTYNLYKNGTRIATDLTTTSYNDNNNAPPTTQYQVAAVVNGAEQTKCGVMTAWTEYVYKLGDNIRTATGYIDIPLDTVYDRDGVDVTSHYEPNDAELADLDGDGQLEIIIKRLNTYDAWNGSELYPINSREFVVLDAYDVNWQTGAATLMWRIDCGPNMASMNSTEINIIAYDWDEDGKAEVVLRGADNMIVYGPDGKKKIFEVGDMTVNTRNKMNSHTNGQYAWTHTGAEYLIYMNGSTGAKYQVITYPLKRLESGESSEKSAWGDGYGHRSTKHFLGAPFLDGRKASLFLARGIYTRHKMIAMKLDRSSHTWSEIWTWSNNSKSSPWYGQGNHNYVIADVDEDGRDEIVYGSMVIDDNGKGLSTTGLGHGDALHVGDFDPYRRGLEFFACNEDKPNCNYRNATTSELYFRSTGSSDDGRALMDNFSNSYPGSLGRSVNTGMISSVTNQTISDLGDFIAWGDLNFRIYFDGDLCSEILNSPGTAREAKIEKPGVGRLFTSDGCNMNNDSKNNPCFQGDIIGDWREEIVVRCGQNLRVYTTGIGTSYSMPSLWFDHQYRQATVWQMMAYNQPPHVSYFLGEMEDITVAPPPLTMEGRTEIPKDGTIGTSLNGKQVLICDNVSTASSFTIGEGARPAVITVNTPKWVQGNNDNNNITIKDDYVHTLKGSALTGTTRLTKQGGGTLRLNKNTHTYTGPTDVWGGTLSFDGSLQNSPLWLNRFTRLESTGGTFGGGISADYGATIAPGGDNTQGSLTTTTLTLNHGARLQLDVYSNTATADQVNASTLVINKQTGDAWTNYGPEYLTPVIELVPQGQATIADGTYDLGAIGTISGQLSDIRLEGLDGSPTSNLKLQEGHLFLVVGTGISNICPKATVAEATFNRTTTNVIPTALITPQSLVVEGNTVTPTLTATFTDSDGNTTELQDLYETLYEQDYEGETEITGWTNSGAPISLGTGDATYGNYFLLDHGKNNTRYAYQRISGVDVSKAATYTIEFDLAMKSGNTDPIEFCVMSKGGTNPSKVWDHYAAINGNANMLFDLDAAKSSTTFSVNGTSTTTTLNSDTWYHYTLEVDQTARTVKWSISNGSSGTFNLPAGTSTEFDGFYLVAGRYYSLFRLDNIRIYATDKMTFTFDTAGTLSVMSSYKGFVSSITTMTSGPIVIGDANCDGSVSVTDIAVVVNHILQLGNDQFNKYSADANGDGDVTVTDIGIIVDMILGKNNPSVKMVGNTNMEMGGQGGLDDEAQSRSSNWIEPD